MVPLAELPSGKASTPPRPHPRVWECAVVSRRSPPLAVNPKEGGRRVSLLILIRISLKLEVGDFVPLLAPVWPASDPRPRTPKISWPKRAGGLGQGTLARGSAAPHLPWLLQHHLRASTSLWAFLGCASQVGLSLYPTCPSLLFREPQLSAGPCPKVTFSFPPCPFVRPAGTGPASVGSQGSAALTVHPSPCAASVSPAGREGQGQGPWSPPRSPVLQRLDSLRGR